MPISTLPQNSASPLSTWLYALVLTASRLFRLLAHFLSSYKTSPALYHWAIDHRPMIYVYDSYRTKAGARAQSAPLIILDDGFHINVHLRRAVSLSSV